jgi:hypothetical protein
MGKRERRRLNRARLMPLDCRPIPVVLDPDPSFGSNTWQPVTHGRASAARFRAAHESRSATTSTWRVGVADEVRPTVARRPPADRSSRSRTISMTARSVRALLRNRVYAGDLRIGGH